MKRVRCIRHYLYERLIAVQLVRYGRPSVAERELPMTTSTTRITQVVKRNGLQVRASFLASLAVLFLSCQTSSRLPQEEAPAEIATGLAILPNTVLLATAKSVVAGKPSQPGTPDGSGVALPAISCSVTKAWWVQ